MSAPSDPARIYPTLHPGRGRPSPLVLALTLFYHNARASVIAVAAGVVPFLFVPLLDPLLNGGVLGLVVSIAQHQRLPVPRLVLTQIMPHGVFELTAVLYATSVGLYLSAAMGRKVRAAWLKSRARKDGASLAWTRGYVMEGR